MVIKLKEGCLVELKEIKIAKVIKYDGGCVNIEISYFDEKKNPKAYILCDSEEEANKLIDILLEKIENKNKFIMK